MHWKSVLLASKIFSVYWRKVIAATVSTILIIHPFGSSFVEVDLRE